MEQEELREKIAGILSDDLITCGFTHENPPPHKDCGEECGVSLESQIVAANPFASPMRSGGKKHKKCMDCWNEYVSKLADQILALTDAYYKEAGYVKLADDQKLPICDDYFRGLVHQGYKYAQQDMLKADWRKVMLED